MLQAGKEEKMLAIKNGDVTTTGIPYITVIVDGGWSHRSFGHRYTSSSGVACVIGWRTKKLLYVGVRNKYCYTCEYRNRNNMSTKHDMCFKNWNGTSAGMESDMIVEAFCSSMDVHGLQYRVMIGDGDSSTFKKIKENVPYGRHVIKRECANHVVKNYTKALFNLQKQLGNIGKRLIPNAKIMKLKILARMAITYNAKNQLGTESLRTDLKNGPQHIFNIHKNCKPYYCKKIQEKNSNNPLISEKILEKINDVLKMLIQKAPQLTTNDTSNLAENYMSLVAKFSGGKQINRGNKGSYTHRSFGAALDFQLGSEWSYKTWKKVAISPYSPLKKFGIKKKLQIEYKRKSLHNLYSNTNNVEPQTKTKNKLFEISNGEKDYGEFCQKLDMEEETFENEKLAMLSSLQVDDKLQHHIQKITIGQAENDQWFEIRKNRLTASNFGIVCKRRSTTKYTPIIKKILYNNDIHTYAIQHGKINEPEAIRKYEQKTNSNVTPCGIFVDKEYGFLAASPDGLVGTNGIIEVKCPYSLVKNGISIDFAAKSIKTFYLKFNENANKINLKETHNYYFQIQGQLHITQKLFCDFIVWTPSDIFVERIFKNNDFWTNKMETFLVKFYHEALLPEIVDPRLCRKMPIRDLT